MLSLTGRGHFIVDCCNHLFFLEIVLLQFSAICCCLDLANIGGILPRSCTRSLFLQMRTNCQIAAFLLRQPCHPWIANEPRSCQGGLLPRNVYLKVHFRLNSIQIRDLLWRQIWQRGPAGWDRALASVGWGTVGIGGAPAMKPMWYYIIFTIYSIYQWAGPGREGLGGRGKVSRHQSCGFSAASSPPMLADLAPWQTLSVQTVLSWDEIRWSLSF